MDKLESIRAFTEVIKEGSFAAAARKMHSSRAVVNKLVINLEKELKVQLLYRTTRKVIPTDAGKAYYERCVNILTDLAEADLAVTKQHQEPKGTLKINGPMSFGIKYLGSIVAEFMSRYPEVIIELTLEDRFVDPIGEGYDIVIRLGPQPESPSLIVEQIASLDRIVCAAPSYLKRYGVPQQPEELINHCCLDYGYLATRNQWQFSRGEEFYRVSVKKTLCSNNGEILRDAAVKGLGVAVLPTFIVEQELRSGNLTQILSDYKLKEIDLWTIYPVNRYLSAKIQLFTGFLQECLRGKW